MDQRNGRMRDFAMFKETKFKIAENIIILADAGYQGLQKEHENSHTPTKQPQGGKPERGTMPH